MRLLLWLTLICIAFITFYKKYRPFGGRTKPETWAASPHFRKNIFVNLTPTAMAISGRDAWSLLQEQLRRGTNRRPQQPVQPVTPDIAKFLAAEEPQLIWLGHSSVLLRIGGKTVLTDPVLSKRASPFSFAGPKRTVSHMPLNARDLPPIDAVLISHDHYDHLDYKTIRALTDRTGRFFVPLGVAAHLQRWGVPADRIEELDWWQTAQIDGLQLACTPARHFSGRTLTDRFKTLWCSWVIQTADTKVFFSGDGGYGPHFTDIGSKFGPFDLTLMECGQYDKRWPDIHMMPEQTVRAHHDVGGDRLLPIHWGAFVLALHPWNGSVTRAQTAADTPPTATLLSPRIGEPTAFKAVTPAAPHWWSA